MELSITFYSETGAAKQHSFRAARDITERIRMEEELRQSEERYRTIIESIEDGYYEVDLVGNYTMINDSLSESTAIPCEERWEKATRYSPRNRKKYTKHITAFSRADSRKKACLDLPDQNGRGKTGGSFRIADQG